MKPVIVHILFCIGLMSSAFAQSNLQNIREGNDAFRNNQYVKAEQEYRKALNGEKGAFESAYNLGDALYRQGKYEEASKYFQAAANKTDDKELKAKAFHNLGNALLKDQKLKESLGAYKQSLINNPKDDETRYNYAYTKQMIQEQEQQQQEQQDQNQDQENQEQQQEEQQNQEQENQEEKNKEEQEQQQQEGEEQQEQEQQQQQQQKEEQVSREDAERILEALNQDEKQLQEKLKKQKIKKVDINIEKDW